MKKFFAFCKSFYKNVIIKRKFKAFWLILTDPEFKANLNRLHDLCKGKKRLVTRRISKDRIVPGHRIVYPAYAQSLVGAVYIPPIKVVYDSKRRKYVIVDGNHRLPAILATSTKYAIVEVLK